MTRNKRIVLAAAVAAATALTSLSANAFWGPFNFMRGWGGGYGGWGGPWGWGGYPYSGWGYPGWGGWGHPGWGGWGHRGWGGWGHPGWGGWGYPYGWGAPALTYPAVAAPPAPAASSDK